MDKEERKEYNRQYRQKNIEKIKLYRKEYYKKNKKRINNKSKQYYSDNKEKCKDSVKKWVEKNKEKLSVYRYKYLKTIMGRATNLLRKYKQSDKKAKRGNCTITAKWIVKNIFSKPCAHCGKIGWDIIGCNRLDNSKPHTEDNVEPCCFECNAKLRGQDIIKEQSKKVYQHTIDGKLIKIWNSIADIHKELNFDKGNISRCCNGKQHKAYDYIWSFTQIK